MNCLECPSAFWVPVCLSAQVPWVSEYPSALWVPECLKCPSAFSVLSAQVPKFIERPSARVLFECLEYLECPSALQVPECLECLWCPTGREPWVPWESKYLSQSPSQLAGLQCWFSKLISTLRTHILRKDLILRLRKLDLISNSSLIKLKSLK